MSNEPIGGPAPESFERLGVDATESVRGDSRRIHELAERFRAQYRRDLEDWMQLRARLDRRGDSLSSRHATASRSTWRSRASTKGSARPERHWSCRIVQEALQNVRKHAAASRVSIGLENDTVVIADNGRGFDLLRLASGRMSNFGLQFMRERAELMGGQLQIESRQGEGTRILLRLPGQRQANTTKEETNGGRG